MKELDGQIGAQRSRLERQPFKQAHREVYPLTDAERETATYSNRFASHIVRQHQFASLCRERGWKFKAMGDWDSHNIPSLDLPQSNLQAKFDVESPEAEDDESTTAHGIYLAIRTEPVLKGARGKLPRPSSPMG